MRPRSLGRRLALQYLFMIDVGGPARTPAAEAFLLEQSDAPEARTFAASLIETVLTAREALDARIQEVTENWSVSRIAAVERNVLRLAAAELDAGEAPPKVVLDEAIHLAKTFGGKDSGRFVNGVLDRLLHHEPAPGEDAS